MNKGELIDAIAAHSKLTKADAGRALEATIETLEKQLKKGDRIALVGFGSFSISKRAARMGRNPQTGKEIKIAAKKVVKFKAGSDLAKKVNKQYLINKLRKPRSNVRLFYFADIHTFETIQGVINLLLNNSISIEKNAPLKTNNFKKHED